MKWFGFGFNGFGQIRANERLNGGGSIGEDLRVTSPTAIEIGRHLEESVTNKTHVRNDNTRIRTSWSRRAGLHLEGNVCPRSLETINETTCHLCTCINNS